MTTATPRKILILCRSAPYGSARARNAVDMAMACGAFDQTVAMLFLGDGVLTLLKAQQPPAGLAKNLAKILGALPDYGIGPIYVDGDALQARGLSMDDMAVPVQLSGTTAMAQLYASHDIVLSV